MGGGDEDMAELTTASDNAADVQLVNFNLPNRKGGGPDLLSGANLTLASGRRYGLMGRNGCGKFDSLRWELLLCSSTLLLRSS